MKRFIFVIVISRLHIPVIANYIRQIRAVIPRCDESLKTVREGFSCPSNELEWKERAKEMKCETFLQNCTDNNDFVYHCLINAWPNGTIEVCAPRQIIAGGYCAEFSKGGACVQTQYKSKCKSCPYKYNSSESFKYQECYDLVKTPELSTKEAQAERTSSIIPAIFNGVENQTITNSTDTKNQFGNALHAEIIGGFFAVVLGLISLVLLVRLFIKLRQCSKSAYEDVNTEVDVLEMNKDLVKYLCKVAKEKPDSLRKKILESSFWNENADSKPKENQKIKVTGDFKEDMAIQAAAYVFEIKIYVVIREQHKKIVVRFLPKDPNAKKWLRISLDNNKTYELLSDSSSLWSLLSMSLCCRKFFYWATCGEEDFTYDEEIVWQIKD